MKYISRMKIWSMVCLVFTGYFSSIYAQGVLISTSPGTPVPGASLELRDTTRGFLLNRMTTAQRNAITNPAVGLQIYNTTTGCFEGYLASGWRSLACNCASFPSAAIQASFLTPGTNQSVTFTPAQLGSGVGYQWQFQGGTPTTSSAASAQASWSVAGNYWVKLIATDASGCSATDSLQISVSTCAAYSGSQSQTFTYTGAMQTFTVPAGVCTVRVEVWGAEGGRGYNSNYGGSLNNAGDGGFVTGDKILTPGTSLAVFVGQKGNDGGFAVGGTGGWNGGGNGVGWSTNYGGGGGGGASDVRLGGTALSNRIIVGGGGGGGSYYTPATGGWGGYPNGDVGRIGDPGVVDQNSGLGGTQSAGGNGGVSNGNGSNGLPGQLGTGGNAGPGSCAGGGGGGYYGGGGGANCNGAGGGGGSSFYGGMDANTNHTNNNRTGNGQVIIRW